MSLIIKISDFTLPQNFQTLTTFLKSQLKLQSSTLLSRLAGLRINYLLRLLDLKESN